MLASRFLFIRDAELPGGDTGMAKEESLLNSSWKSFWLSLFGHFWAAEELEWRVH